MVPLQNLYIARAEIDAAIKAIEGRIVPPAKTVSRAGIRKRAPRRTDVELAAIRADYQSAMPVAEIVARHRISLDSLYTTASQQGWKRPPRERRPMMKKPVEAPKPPPKAQSPVAEVHPAEAHARHTLTQAGYRIEHLGEARWRLNGVAVDRTLFVTMGYHVRTKQPLPKEWLAKAAQ